MEKKKKRTPSIDDILEIGCECGCCAVCELESYARQGRLDEMHWKVHMRAAELLIRRGEW